MSEFFKNKKRMALVLGLVILLITAVTGGVAFVLGDYEWSMSAFAVGEPEPSGQEEQPSGEDPDSVQVPQEPEEEPELEAEEIVHFNTPGEMRGVFLVPGTDFLKNGTSSTEAQVRTEIDAALDAAKDLTMNSVIIDTSYGERVIYQSKDAKEVSSDFDIMQYLVDGARERGLYTYAIFDVSLYRDISPQVTALSGDAQSIDKLSVNLREFAEAYRLDGILIDGYQNRQQQDSYGIYLVAGGGIGYDNFLRQSPEALVKTSSGTIRRYAKGTQVGLLADSVWANAGDDEAGSNTRASYTALYTANADTKAFVEEEDLLDFVAVKAYGSLTDTSEPFKEVVAWWSELARDNGISFYAVHASNRACTDAPGWESHDQLTKQVIEAEDFSGYRGSMFNSLVRLSEDPKDTTATLIKYYNNEVEAAHILTELAITKPDQSTFTTFEPRVTFTGASDPNSPVVLNGEEIPTDASGYFTVAIDLDPGLNTFTIEHKEKVLTYSITRQIQILKEISPMGNITTDGGMTITITAVAYSDASVYATVGGTTVPMEIDDLVEDEENRDSNYATFVGEYTAPAATESVQNLGNIVVSASWASQNDSMTGAAIKINKKAKVEDGVSVVVSASQAKTYPPNTLNNIPNSNFYPLPQGAMDYAVGDEIVYKNGSATYTYYVLASGLRVSSGDIKPAGDYASGNAISGMTVSADGTYTYVTLKMSQKVAYTFNYTQDGVNITFHYTSSVPGNLNLDSNPLFSSATWNDTTLQLRFIKQAAFMGYRGYYDENGNLVLRFKNPKNSLSGARVAIDPGHGGKDPGALGFLADYPEKVINLAIARELKEELESRGASVLLIDNSSNPSKAARVQQAENWNADFFVSVHNNTSSNSKAVGTEVYYFYPYSYPLALYTSSNVSSQFATTNRGPKKSHYHVTLSSEFPSVLVECGFLSNKDEYEKLLKNRNQNRIAVGIADGIAAHIKAVRTGSNATGEQSIGGSVAAGNESTQGFDSQTDTIEDTLTLSASSITLNVGERDALYTEHAQGEVVWESGNTSVARVDEDGRITAVSEGTAKITAADEDGNTVSCAVTVTDEEDREASSSSGTDRRVADAADLYFDSDTYQIKDGGSLYLVVQSDIGEIRSSDLIWESIDEDVATVNIDGKVTARSPGETDIFVESKDGRFNLYCTVIVA